LLFHEVLYYPEQASPECQAYRHTPGIRENRNPVSLKDMTSFMNEHVGKAPSNSVYQQLSIRPLSYCK